MKSKPETLQNRIIKETSAKKRISKALSVQKKMQSGRTDKQTRRHTDVPINGIGIGTTRPLAYAFTLSRPTLLCRTS